MPIMLEIKVMPSSGRNMWLLDKGGALKCYLKSPAEKNLANKELIQLLADALHISRSAIIIVAGATSRKKLVKIALDISREKVLACLGVQIPEVQQTFL